jgi:starvation-inducible outer membrane lipoprotein
MRILVFVMIMLISACVSNTPGNLQGNSVKADRAVVYKHLDADPNYISPDGYQCRSGSVLACTVQQGKSDCSCHSTNDLEDRATRMISRGERGAIRRSRGFRQ